MDIIENIVLGVIQGLTEFIPISSSGHLVVAQNFFSGASDHLFLEWINIGTMLALIVYFWDKIVGVLVDITKNRKYRLARNILLTSIPAGIVGYLSADFIESNLFFSSLLVVAFMLALVGVIMILIDKFPRASNVEGGEALSATRALIIGVAQVVALIPGTSRSGSTIIAGRLTGLSSKDAAEYSFLASLPIMAGVTLKIFVQDQSYLASNFTALFISNFAAFVAGMLAVGFLMNYLAKHSLALFGWYRLVLASVIVVILLLQ